MSKKKRIARLEGAVDELLTIIGKTAKGEEQEAVESARKTLKGKKRE